MGEWVAAVWNGHGIDEVLLKFGFDGCFRALDTLHDIRDFCAGGIVQQGDACSVAGRVAGRRENPPAHTGGGSAFGG